MNPVYKTSLKKKLTAVVVIATQLDRPENEVPTDRDCV